MKYLIHVGENETHEWDRRKMLNVEYGAMERVTGYIGGALEDALNNGGALAMTALVWVLRKRTYPRLRFEEVVFEMDDLMIEAVNDDGTPLVPEPEAPKAAKKAAKAAKKVRTRPDDLVPDS
jgi:hypothetical protein